MACTAEGVRSSNTTSCHSMIERERKVRAATEACRKVVELCKVEGQGEHFKVAAPVLANLGMCLTEFKFPCHHVHVHVRTGNNTDQQYFPLLFGGFEVTCHRVRLPANMLSV